LYSGYDEKYSLNREWGRRNFYSHRVPQLHIFVKGIPLPCINKSLVDFMLGIREYFIMESFSYIKVYRSKPPPRALPIACPISLFMLELVIQSTEDGKIGIIKKFKNLPWLKFPCKFGFYILNCHQSIVNSIVDMDMFCLD